MKYGLISPPKRRFGNDVIDIVPIRGLRSGGPYHTPEIIKKDRVYIVPITINTPGFDTNQNLIMEAVEGICTILKDYLRVKSEVVDLGEVQTINVPDYSVCSARDLYHRLNKIEHELIRRGYREKLSSTVVLVFTRSTARPIKVTPYYVTKIAFGLKPVSQVITEKALANPKMSYTNIALGIFTKLGGIPWRLNELIPSTDLIIGVGRTILRYYESFNQREVIESWMGSIAIIRSDGVFREARATIVKTEKELADWIAENISKTINNFIIRHAVEEVNVSIHYSGKKVSKEEMESIEEVVEEIRKREGIRINVKIIHVTNDIPHRLLCEKYNMYPFSGFYWISSEREAYITPLGASLIGSKVYYSFTGIPHTLKVTVVKTIGSITLRDALIDSLHEVHSLTFMHLAGLNININEPISTKYSRELAYLVRSLEIASKTIGTTLPATMVYDKLWFL